MAAKPKKQTSFQAALAKVQARFKKIAKELPKAEAELEALTKTAATAAGRSAADVADTAKKVAHSVEVKAEKAVSTAKKTVKTTAKNVDTKADKVVATATKTVKTAAKKVDAKADKTVAATKKVVKKVDAQADKAVATATKTVKTAVKKTASTVKVATGTPDASWTVAQLRAYSKNKGIVGYSSKSKPELLKAIAAKK